MATADAPAQQPAATRAAAPRLAHVPALDGLRGLAVLGVLLFHGGVSWAAGGFLGVSVFFTLSGFLITSLLLVEHRARGRIDLGAFWGRRARRLLPAALLTLLAVALYGALLAEPAQLAALRGDVFSALGYVANWRFVFAEQPYAALFSAPSPVQHFWSLAIEEQFYVLFPLVVVGALAWGRGRRRILAAVLAGLATASAVALLALYHPGDDPSRVYYGTDTRAFELLAGALLALVLVGRGAVRRRAGRVAVAMGGTLALALLLVLGSTTAHTSTWLYEGGLAGVAVLTVLVLLAALQPAGPVVAVLTLAPLRALGLVSYGAYLIHWPVYLWLTEARTGLEGPALLALRLAVTLGLAVLSYRLVEQPVRAGRALARPGRWVAAPVALGVAGAVVVATLAVSAGHQQVPFALGSSPAVSGVSLDRAPTLDLPAAPARAALARAAPDGSVHAGSAEAPAEPLRVLVVGDSVARTVGAGLERWAAATGRAAVWTVAVPGCGVARGGLVQFLGEVRPAVELCDAWPERWAQHLAEFDPHVVVVLSGSWDLLPRQVPGWDAFRTPGEPDFDRWLLGEYAAAVDVLSSAGARVVWLTTPCARSPEGFGTDTQWSGVYDDAVVAHVDSAVLPRLAAMRPRLVSLVDLHAVACPTGTFQSEVLGVADARPDGLHFSDAGADRLAGWLGEVADAQRRLGLRRIDPPLPQGPR